MKVKLTGKIILYYLLIYDLRSIIILKFETCNYYNILLYILHKNEFIPLLTDNIHDVIKSIY